MDPVKVLLVEDDEDDHLLICDLLAEIGETKYALDWAASYDEGLGRIASGHYDFCLLDYRLGAQSGLDFLRELRRLEDPVPAILLTGQGDRELDLRAAQLGAWDYLSKQELELCPRLLERAIRYGIASKQHEEERVQLALAREAQRQAEAANHAKDELLAIISHELRGPLNAIISWAAVLQQLNIDTVLAAKAVSAIERSVKQQVRMIEDLLDITRIVQGTLAIEKRPVELASVVEEAISTVRPSAEAKSIALEVTSDPALGLVLADPGRLQQVMVNLLSNSIKFTPKAGTVEIRLERVQDSAGSQVQLTVKDTGAGIDPAFLPYVFDRYRQASDSRSGRQGGLGLGLAIVRSLVELHGGSVHAESPGEGLGATFTVRLPLPSSASERPSEP
ncbi:MAG: ATP-binding protein [Gammaproteobacteria bacterium]